MARAKLAPVDVGDVKDVEGWMVVVSSLVSGSLRRGQVSTVARDMDGAVGLYLYRKVYRLY